MMQVLVFVQLYGATVYMRQATEPILSTVHAATVDTSKSEVII